jgi:starvation-inducible DNA-binding protein
MQTNIGIKPDQLNKVAHSLNQLLADEHVLYIKTRKAHWNVEGPDFYTQHKFFEEHYEQLQDIIDDVAERIRILGHYAVASMKEYIKLTHLSEESRSKNDSMGFMNELLADHETIIMHLRESIDRDAEWHDQGTSDFSTGLIRTHEKMAWMLRAHIPGK